jgi:hypothetical protein
MEAGQWTCFELQGPSVSCYISSQLLETHSKVRQNLSKVEPVSSISLKLKSKGRWQFNETSCAFNHKITATVDSYTNNIKTVNGVILKTLQFLPHNKPLQSLLQTWVGQCCLRKFLFIARVIRNVSMQCRKEAAYSNVKVDGACIYRWASDGYLHKEQRSLLSKVQ